MMRLAIVILFIAAQAQAVTRYVSPTGNGTAPFLTWEEASTNIQFAINASENGDTILVAPGTYTNAVTINKKNLTVQGGNGTLWDADRTIIDRQGAGRCVLMSASNSILRGFTLTGGVVGTGGGGGAYLSGANTTIDSCVVRGNVATGNGSGVVLIQTTTKMINCIVVGNSGTYAVLFNVPGATMLNSIVEANAPSQILPFSDGALAFNSIYGNIHASPQNLLVGGNVTNSTSNSVVALLGIAPASIGVGTNLVWAGVAAYIPRIGSLVQGAGVGYAGVDTSKSGDGGPALLPIGAKFLGIDSSTNLNHGGGSALASTNTPFLVGGSAAFDGSGGIVSGQTYARTNWTIEAWVWAGKSATQYQSICGDKGYAGTTSGTMLGFNWAANTFSCRYGDALGNNGRVDAVLARSNWYHLAATKTGTTVTIYTNGVAAATGSTTTNACGGTGSFAIGKWTDSALGNFDGNVSEVRIWNVARTQPEIASSYTNRLTGSETGLVGYWRLDERDTPITTGPFNVRNPTLQPSFMEAF